MTEAEPAHVAGGGGRDGERASAPGVATRQRLIDGALETIRAHGVAGASARGIAAACGVNQALIFYHFGSVDNLLATACRAATAARVAAYRDRLAQVTTLRELLALGRDLHAEEQALGNVTVLAQLLAGAQGDPRLAPATAEAMAQWTTEIEAVLRRIAAGSIFGDLVDPAGLANAVAAGFVGVELFDGVNPAAARAALAALDQLAVLVDLVEDLGPVARRALRGRLARAHNRA